MTIEMRPTKLMYVVLFSPAVVLMIWAIFVAVDGWRTRAAMIFFLVVLAVCVAAAEGVRTHLRRLSRKERNRARANGIGSV